MVSAALVGLETIIAGVEATAPVMAGTEPRVVGAPPSQHGHGLGRGGCVPPVATEPAARASTVTEAHTT